ncbi:MAG TPA: agmatinase, partial [Gemmatimonadota bacterium]|nr:agmatinase [Gemmatimonadota bacterium]
MHGGRCPVPASLEALPWTSSDNFMGHGTDAATWEEARVVVLPVPYEATTSYGPGTRSGPEAIIEASAYVELYDEELDVEPWETGMCTLPSLELPAAGPEVAVARLRDHYADLLSVSGDRFILTLGGEHSISSAPIHAWLDRLDGDLSVLQLDAHSDLRESYHGTPWSHAAVMRRVLDRTSSLTAVGIRSLTGEERRLIDERGVTTVFAEELRGDGWVEKALSSLGEKVYITFDVDFFDPSLLPATGTPEPGGGTWWQALDLLRAVFREREVVAADIVELAPALGPMA